ncbi:MAG TPA: YebC/PmpR family DNA-binding transcriptional regulator [Anaerolineaceae bacterium]|nr:YebC/PmpR family DNA-binding transcriptional regulator [Anaerolineaceae bacterium]HPN51054.1 YebC/PmpR family DNA-binding transcriptional regulator [Anaerolineaceae bacterium]
MSGHSHWATIKRKKGAADAKKGQVFTRLAREIVLAAREGGGDPDNNVGLQLAIERARAQNMPKDGIERAIKRGTGESKDGVVLEENTYEGYASNGIALIIECVTENRNRTVAEIRHILSRSGGSMAESGSVAWQFTRNAYFSFPSKGLDFDKVFELAVEAGADNIVEEDGEIEIFAPVESFKKISTALHNAKIHPDEAGLRMFPNMEVELDVEKTMQVLKVIEALEEFDDVQNVYSNLKISEEAMAALESE